MIDRPLQFVCEKEQRASFCDEFRDGFQTRDLGGRTTSPNWVMVFVLISGLVIHSMLPKQVGLLLIVISLTSNGQIGTNTNPTV
jgi:hypothetical protein